MEKQSNIKLVILDFDGTLVDLATDWKKVKSECNKYFRSENLVVENLPFSLNLNSILQGLIDNNEIIRAKKIKKNISSIIDREEMLRSHETIVKTDAVKIVEELKKKFLVAILSDNGKEIIYHAIKKFKFPRLKKIVSRNDVLLLKPDPEGIIRIQSSLGLKGGECIFIGNSDFDLKTANFVGTLPILIGNKSKTNYKYTFPSLTEAYDKIISKI